MTKNIEITGGYSGNRTIMIMSRSFVGKACAISNNEIVAWSEKIPETISWTRKKNFWFLPKIIRLMIILLCMTNKKHLIGFIVTFPAVILLSIMIGPINIPTKAVDLPQYTLFILPALIFIYLFIFIAPWHGAEHKAITAYMNHKWTGIKKIKKASRVTKLCGSRLLIPLLLTILIPCFFNGIHSMIVLFALLEITLWIDALWGWNNVPIFSHISLFIQRFILTREPGPLEIHTAQAALKALIVAHGQEIQNQ